jgi:hypothetical protein
MIFELSHLILVAVTLLLVNILLLIYQERQRYFVELIFDHAMYVILILYKGYELTEDHRVITN